MLAAWRPCASAGGAPVAQAPLVPTAAGAGARGRLAHLPCQAATTSGSSSTATSSSSSTWGGPCSSASASRRGGQHAARAINKKLDGPLAGNQMLVFVPPHPLVKHWLAVLRNATTPCPIFRNAAAELGRVLIYEAMNDFLPTMEGVVDTPMGPADVTFVDPTRPIKVVPVLRAGLVLLEQAQQVMPAHQTYHVGYVRDEVTLEATSYLNKLPARFAEDDLVLVTDPMLATGGTMVKVLDDIVARGAKPANIRVVAIVCAPPALTKMSDKFKGLRIYTAMIDPEVNDKGFIIPGLGDAGDRAFGTAG